MPAPDSAPTAVPSISTLLPTTVKRELVLASKLNTSIALAVMPALLLIRPMAKVSPVVAPRPAKSPASKTAVNAAGVPFSV